MTNANNAADLLKVAVRAKDKESVRTAFAALMDADPAAARKLREDLISQGFNRLASTPAAGA